MLRLQVDLTNEEMQALEPKIAEIDAQLAKRLQTPEHQPHSKFALAWAAWRRLTLPIREHLVKIGRKR